MTAFFHHRSLTASRLIPARPLHGAFPARCAASYSERRMTAVARRPAWLRRPVRRQGAERYLLVMLDAAQRATATRWSPARPGWIRVQTAAPRARKGPIRAWIGPRTASVVP